jgi:hypothetical protein
LAGRLAASSWALQGKKRNSADLCKKLSARLVQQQRCFKQLPKKAGSKKQAQKKSSP